MLRRLKIPAILVAGLLAAALAVSLSPLRVLAQSTSYSDILLTLEMFYGTGVNGSASRTNASSGNVAAATATATLAAVAAKTNYITGWDVNAGGATAASIVSCTVTGLAGGTETRALPVVAGVTAPNTPLVVRYPAPIPASAVNVAIVVSCPTLGAGNTNATVNAYGFVN